MVSTLPQRLPHRLKFTRPSGITRPKISSASKIRAGEATGGDALSPEVVRLNLSTPPAYRFQPSSALTFSPIAYCRRIALCLAILTVQRGWACAQTGIRVAFDLSFYVRAAVRRIPRRVDACMMCLQMDTRKRRYPLQVLGSCSVLSKRVG